MLKKESFQFEDSVLTFSEQESNINAGLLVRIGIQCVIIGTYPPSVQPGLAVDTLERLALYLGEQGF